MLSRETILSGGSHDPAPAQGARPGRRTAPAVRPRPRSGLQGHRRRHRRRVRLLVVEVAPHGGPPLHVHHRQEETIHVLSGRFKIRIGEETFRCDPGGFAYMPSGVPHAFLNLTGEPARIVIVYT